MLRARRPLAAPRLRPVPRAHRRGSVVASASLIRVSSSRHTEWYELIIYLACITRQSGIADIVIRIISLNA